MPTTSPPPAGRCPARRACSASGSSTTRNPPTFALIQPGRSTTATGPTRPWLVSPVKSRTGCWTTAVRPRSSATTARASGEADWALPGEPDAGGDRHVPVDHLCAAHGPTVRARLVGSGSWPQAHDHEPVSGSRSPPGPRPPRRSRRPPPAQLAGARHLRRHDREEQQRRRPCRRRARPASRRWPGCPSWPARRRARRRAADAAEDAVARRQRPAKPATGSPVMAPRSFGVLAATASTRTSVSGAIASSRRQAAAVDQADRRGRCRAAAARSSSASAAPLNVAGRPSAIATCLARFSAITLLDSCSICSTIAASGGELTLASSGADAGAAAGAGAPVTVMPSRASRRANAAAVMPAGSVGPRAVVDRVVGVFERAAGRQPSLVGLERDDRRDVSCVDVAVGPPWRHIGPAVQRGVIA